jgi:hypothetical protein
MSFVMRRSSPSVSGLDFLVSRCRFQVPGFSLTGNGSENMTLETSTIKLETCNLKRFTVCGAGVPSGLTLDEEGGGLGAS